MPRPNQPRAVAAEQALARRIAYEREARGWTYDGLAVRMTQAGCHINASAIYKMEKADPPRRITVDELVGLSRAFGIPVGQLLLPPELVAKREALTLWSEFESAMQAYLQARERLDEAEGRVLDLVDTDDTGAVLDALRGEVGDDADVYLANARLLREGSQRMAEERAKSGRGKQ